MGDTEKPQDTETTVFVEVAHEVLSYLKEWSEPVQLRIVGQEANVLRLIVRRDPVTQQIPAHDI